MTEHSDWHRERERSASPRRNGSGGGRSPVRERMDEDRRDLGGDSRGRSTTQSSSVSSSQNPGNNLHISGLSTRCDDKDLEELFGKFGRIEKVSIMRDPHTRESRGFAFVTMEVVEDADNAVAALAATEFMGRTLGVERARRARARTPTPGQYQGPPKREDSGYRPYEPSRGAKYGGGYDSYDRRDDRDRYRDDRYRDDRRYDDRRYDSRYDSRDRRSGTYDPRRDTGYAVPMRGGDRYERDRYDDRRRY